MEKKKERIAWIDLLRVIGVIGVILIHVVSNTIIRNAKFTYQTCIYHVIKSFSSCVNDELNLIFFSTNGAKNINPTIEESITSQDMLLFDGSIY